MSHKLTAEQEEIVAFPTKSSANLMIKAVAGAAKSYTLTLMAKNISGRALSCAFNKRIAEELKEVMPDNFDCKTLNSLGHSAFQAAVPSKRLKLDSNKLFTIVKTYFNGNGEFDGDTIKAFANLLGKVRMAGYIPPGDPLEKYRTSDPIRNFNEKFFEDVCFEADVEYTRTTIPTINKLLLQSINMAFQQGAVDFDDQLYMSVFFGGKFQQYPTVMVDEAQDLSPINHMMIEKSLAPGGRLIVVGDPYQSIYAFRGAASNSMDLFAKKFEFETLQLTASFRVPKIVGEKQKEYVPHFNSFVTNAEGEIHNWNKPDGWSIHDIPANSFVLCRNNAPLFSLVMKLVLNKIRCQMLGRDLSAALAGIIKKLVRKRNVEVAELLQLLNRWKETELAKVTDSAGKTESIYDRYDCLVQVCSAAEVTDAISAIEFIEELFRDKANAITLATGHRSKGLERDWVMHLDPWRVPSKRAETDEEIAQERNLKYVIETRTRHTLVEADLSCCVEVGDDR